jgi:hypothetical protein
VTFIRGRQIGWTEKKQQVAIRLRSGQALHCATPDFLLSLVALANFMRLSLRKAAYVAPDGAAM